MTKTKLKTSSSPTVKLVMESEVARQIRQHGRSSMKVEVCGVLVGSEHGQTTVVEACIAGANAAQGGAHVTFTQDTWEHIYQVKDREYPEARIVGWYHSHPGFGVFLSEHDLFIHQNFFSSPQQVAWVYDPHNDEEGCFGWHDGKIEKLDDVSFRFNQAVGESNAVVEEEQEIVKIVPEKKNSNWMLALRDALFYLTFTLLGAAGVFFFLDRKVYMIPRDAQAMVLFVQKHEPVAIPPEIAERVMREMQNEIMQQQLKMQQSPAPQQSVPGTKEGQNGGR